MLWHAPERPFFFATSRGIANSMPTVADVITENTWPADTTVDLGLDRHGSDDTAGGRTFGKETD